MPPRANKKIKIETIKPNRLKINLDFGIDKLSVTQKYIEGDLSVKWLHGGIAKNLFATISVTLTQSTTKFDRYPEFIFDDPFRKFWSEELTVFEGELNVQGKARISANIYAQDAAPGMLKASFITRVFEKSGDFSVDMFSIPYSPYESYVGIKLPRGDKARGMLLTDTAHVVNVITVDPGENPISRNIIEVKVYKVSWRWWWDASENNLASYAGNSQPTHICKPLANMQRKRLCNEKK